MKKFTQAAGSEQKLPALFTNTFSEKKENLNDNKTLFRDSEHKPTAVNEEISDFPSFTTNRNNNASYSLIPTLNFSTEGTSSSLKISFMRQILRYLQNIITIILTLPHFFLNELFKIGIFNKQWIPEELHLVPVNIAQINSLTINKRAIGNSQSKNFRSDSGIYKCSFLQTITKSVKGLFLALILIISAITVASATTYYSRANGNWNSSTTWSTVSYTSNTNAGTFPVAGDIVNIGNGFTVTVTVNAGCASITYDNTINSANNTITITSGITLTVSGAITIPRLTNNTNTLAVGAGTLNAGSIAFTNGGGGQRHQLTISTGTATITGNVTETGSTGSATIAFTGAGLLQLGGTIFTSATGTLTTATGCTVEYNGSGAQNIGDFAYVNLKLSGGNTKTLQTGFGTSTTSASGTLTVLQNTTLNLSTAGIATPTNVVMDGGATTGATISGTGTLTLGGNVTVNDATTGTSGATISAPISLTNGQTRTFTVADDGTSATDFTISGIISSTGSIVKAGAGTMVLSSANTYSGTTTISQGILSASNIVVVGGNSNLGNATSAVVLGSGSTSGTLSYTGNTATFTRGFTVSAGGGGITNTTANLLTITTGGIANGGQLNLSNTGTGGTTISSVISGAGSVLINNTGSGVTTYSGTNTYTGTTTVSSGVLQLGNTNVISNSSNFILNGGTFKSGATTGFSETVGTLQLSANSTIGLGTGSHTITFANSSGVSWTAAQTLSVTGWTGTAGSSGTAGKIFVGVGGLTATQLAQISFNGFPGTPIILGTGELVPAAQNPNLGITGTTNNGSSCIGIAAPTQTYTITNTGGTASGVTVVSNNPQFVVSALSSTTIAGSGGTATYKVTFTPGSSGPQSATITVSSTTSGSNSPTSTPTGTGNANNTTSIPSSNPTLCINTGISPSITIATTGATGILNDGTSGANGLPAGVSAHWSGNVITISGTPTTTSGSPFNYSIPLTGGCGTVNATGTITVNPTAAIASVTTDVPFICIGGTTQATANGVVLGGGTGTWTSTGGININQSGLITASGSGLATVTYTISGGCGGTQSASQNIFVSPNAAVTSVSGQSPLCVGDVTVYNADVPSSGITGEGTWSSDNTNVATVDSSTGEVTAVGKGTANISFTVTGGCGGTASASQQVTVNAAPQIATPPTNQTVTYGAASVSFSTGATADTYIPAPTYQWQVSSGSGFNDITGETSSTLTIANPTVAMNGYLYHVILTNSCGSLTSNDVSLTVNKANAVINVTPYNVTYNGNSHTATATATGVLGEDFSALVDLSATTHTNAGTYNGDAWTFAGNNNYNAANGTVNNAIGKANAVITVDPYTVNYDGNPHTSTFTAVGIESPTPVNLTSLMDVSATTHTNAGAYNSDAWTFAGNNNYNAANGTVNNDIGKANAVITVNPYTVNYDGNPHTSTFTAVGIESPTPVNLTSLMDVSATTHTNAGTYNGDAWTFAGNNNYNAANGTVNNDIGKANAVITVNPYTVNYDGNPHTSTFTAVGIESPTPVDLSSLMDVSGTTHTNAGTYNGDAWTFAGNNNYNAANGTVNNDIGKANAVITVNPYTVNYDGNPHTSTFTAVGIESPTPVNLASLMDVSATTHTNAGTYNSDTWTFAGNNNYNAANGTVNNDIGTEAITVTADPQTKVYGSPDPALTYHITTGTLASSDAFTGSLTRNHGESAGTYPITQGTLALSNNYDLTFAGANLTITNIPITASASAGIVECVGGTTTLTVTASGGDGALQYSIDGGANYQPGNTFTVNAAGSPYVVTVKDADGFTQNTNSVTVTEQPSPTISLTSGAGTDGQILCIGNSIHNITYAIGGNTTGATVTSLPTGLSGSFSGGVFTISGTPASPGSYPYTVSTTGPCTNVSLSGTITVNDNSTISLSSASANETKCINTSIDNITYNIGGGATGATVDGLPNGVSGTYNAGVLTISGTPTVSGTFNYTVSTEGPCNNPTASGTIIINGNSSIDLSTSATTTAQTVCINTAISNIVYTIDDGATGGGVTGLPNGVTGVYNSGTFTISGTPTESGTFNYTVTATGPCEDATLSGTITVNANSTISLSSTAGTDAQTVCINNPIAAITYNIDGGGTGASITVGALPHGVTGSFSSGMFTITGTPTESGTFNYTITTSGPCVNASVSGSITVNANSTISLSSASGSDGQTVCINNSISGISYAIGGGGTSASITAGALPNGVTSSYSGGVFTITGTPTQSGTFNYTVTTGGPCVNVSVSGTVTVKADATISLTSGAGSDAQSVCLNNQINNITYSIGGSGTGATLSGTLPIGVTGSFSGGVFTISGIPSQSGVFNYTVTTTGPCVKPVANGSITVNPLAVVNAVASVTYCNHASGNGITFTSPTPGAATYSWTSTADVGFGASGNGNISTFTATNNTNSIITATISVTATINGCSGSATTFTITVNPSAVVNPVSNLTYCNNDHASAIVFSSPVTGGTETYSWTSSVNIGFGLNGTGNIGAFTAVNTSINPISTIVTVTPSFNGCAGSPISFTLTVNPGANAGTISGSSTICPGSTSQFATNGSLGGTWSSTNQNVATVDPTTGLVTGVATGNTTIFYNVSNVCGGSSASFAVSVNPTVSAGTIAGPATLCVGSSTLLTTNGNSGGTWFSASPNVSISPSGMITGLSAGPATVFYYVVTTTCGSSISAPFTLTVNAGSNPGTIIGSSSMCAGTANLLLSTGTPGGTWSSSNTGVAAIDGNSGFVLAFNPGTTTISYKVASNSCSSGSQTAFFTLTVNPGGNAGVISGTANICAGTTTTLSSTGSTGGTWSSGNPSIATVDPNTGMVTGVAAGNVIITYQVITSNCGNGKATFTMFISPGANAGTISGPSSVCAGSAISLSTNGTAGGTWSSSNTGVAIVDSHGQVAGQSAGSATITYSVSSACATSTTSTNITVNPLPNAGTVSGASSVCAGLSTPFSSTGNTGGIWSSSNQAVATVNSASGVVTGVSAGSATITYTVATTSCATAAQSAPITVTAVLNAGSISGGSTVCMSSSLNLSSAGSSGGTWTSSNTAVATVNGTTGVVTPVTSGNTTITYTVSNICGNSSTTQVVTVTALPNAGTVSGTASVCAGASTTLSSNGNSGGTWSSSNTSIATVNPSTGVVTAVAAGNATITYSVTTGCGSSTASEDITVNPLASAGTISGPDAVCVVASINLSSGIAGGTWSSNSPTIATVDNFGKVTGVAAGNATITYTVSTSCGTNVASYNVTVNAAPNAGIIPGTVSSVCVGSSILLTDVGGMTNGIWRSVNPARATVDPATGVVTGVSAGNTIIAYTVTNSCGTSSANLPINVNSLPNAGTISGLTSVCVASTINLSASGDAGGTWTSNNTAVATVDPNTGIVSGVASGTATIIYTVGSNAVCGTSSATYLITVNPLAVAGTINGTTTVCTGLSTTLTSNGSVGGTWSSSNPAVASVNSVSGVVTGVSAGNATINYTVSNLCGSTTASTTVTVNPVANAGTVIGATSVCTGSTINLSSNVGGGTWTSSAPAIAGIDTHTGVVTGIAPGNTTITYTVTTSCGTASTTYAITVNPLPNAGSISGTTFVCTGSTTTLFSNMNGGTWSSSNTSAATVNPATGVVTGVSAGNTTITYTVSSGCGNAVASVIVTVGASPNAGTVTGVPALCVGLTAIFTSNGTGGGSWSSNNPSAASVDPGTGVVTGIAMGSATISYTVSSTCGSSVSSANITISALPNAGTLTGTTTICAGSTSTFTSNGTAGGSWSSNNNLVASVNSSGVVTAVAPGNATITYTVLNTCGTATATANVTINALPNAGAVTGASSVCAGVITAFSSSGTGGGTWSSNNTAAATVDPVTGAVTGVAAGSATISYTVTAGTCGSSTSSANITVNPSPNPGTISGATSVCAGATTTFTSNGMLLGTWSSNNTAVATVDPSTGVITGVAAGTTTIKYTITNGCGTASATKPVIVNPLANAGTVSGSSTVCIASATGYTTDGLSGGVWSSNNTAIATVDPASGLVTGVSVGNATITYTVTTGCGTASASSGITVIILPNAGTVSGASSVCVGSNTTYSSNGLSGGTWSSVTPSVATVNPATGVVTGVSAGNATITYTFTNSCGTSNATKLITVNPLPDAGVLSGASSVCIGSIATFNSSGLGGGSWSSSNPSLASIDPSTGVLTGIAAGNVIITYTSTTPCGITTATAPIAVIAIPNAGAVSGNTTVCVGANTPYTTSGMTGGIWSSVTPSVATVDPSTGIVTGVSAGNATIVYTFSNACGSPTASQMITVNPLPNAGTITGAATVCAGSQATFASSGLAGGSWSSDNTAVATVNPTSGVVMGVSSGNATITYTSTTPCGTVSKSAAIIVNAIVSAGTVSGISALCIGSTTPYTTDGTTGGIWSSLTPSVASVNPTTGVVTGVSTGNATITYTVTGCGTSSASKLIAVSPASNPGTISGPSSVCAGSTVTFTRSGGSAGGTWSSSNTSVATVNSSGTVTAVGNGNAVISYAVTSGCATNSSTQPITVTTAPNIVANNITASTDPNSCSASVTLGPNITPTGSGTTLEFRIGFFWFSFPITSTYTFFRGTTPVMVRATNSCGSVMKLFLVTVVDNQPPAITCVPNATRTTDGNSNKYSVRGHEFDATASDGCGVASLVYSLSGATVEGFERENTSLNNVRLNVGTTTITWKATDVNGNVSTCSTNVTVNANPGHNFRTFDAPTLKVKVAPNPTSNYFTLQFSSESAENVKIIVTDDLGRTVEQVSNIWPNSSLQIGGKYHPGVYIVQAIQGDYMVPLKLIKEGR